LCIRSEKNQDIRAKNLDSFRMSFQHRQESTILQNGFIIKEGIIKTHQKWNRLITCQIHTPSDSVQTKKSKSEAFQYLTAATLSVVEVKRSKRFPSTRELVLTTSYQKTTPSTP